MDILVAFIVYFIVLIYVHFKLAHPGTNKVLVRRKKGLIADYSWLAYGYC